MTLWLYVTNDKYELPLVVADSLPLLARKLGIKPNTIYTALNRGKNLGYRCRYVKVVIDESEEENV